MRYMLMIYGNSSTWDSWTKEEYDEVIAAHRSLLEELKASGEYVDSAGLTVRNARQVRTLEGEAAVTDGPFTEAKEVLAGYYLVDCDGIERATEIAGRIRESRWDPIEVREIIEDPLS